MVRVKRGVTTRRKHKKILAQAKGYRGVRHSVFKHAKIAVIQAGVRAYNDRKKNKRNFRRLWNVRINAASRKLGVRYSECIDMLSKAESLLNRKILADIAATDEKAFETLIKTIQK
jgi:large subunit ribosomal protein L20